MRRFLRRQNLPRPCSPGPKGQELDPGTLQNVLLLPKFLGRALSFAFQV